MIAFCLETNWSDSALRDPRGGNSRRPMGGRRNEANLETRSENRPGDRYFALRRGRDPAPSIHRMQTARDPQSSMG